MAVDLDAYFRRIGYAGAREPTLDTLAALHLCHAQSIAFENLDPLLGRPVLLDAPALERKLVHDRRGGYCYEQNLLFGHVLKALGFHVTGLAARVLWTYYPEDAITARTHQLLRVELADGPYVVDVGFGGQTLTGPLRLGPDLEQATPHEPFRLATAGEGFRMQCKIGAAWKTLYRFDLQEQFQPDYEILNYYAATHPASRFVRTLMAARPATGCRYALFNDQLAVHHLGGPTERRILGSVAEVRETLERLFLLSLPDAPELDTALGRLPDAGIETGLIDRSRPHPRALVSLSPSRTTSRTLASRVMTSEAGSSLTDGDGPHRPGQLCRAERARLVLEGGDAPALDDRPAHPGQPAGSSGARR